MVDAESTTPTVGETAGVQGGADEGPRASSADDLQHKEARPFTVHEGGKGDSIHTLLDLPEFGRWARSVGLTEANLQSAWRTGAVDGYPGRIATASFRAKLLVTTGDIEPLSDPHRTSLQKEYEDAQPRFPKQVPLAAIAEPPSGVDLNSPDVFVCHDERGQIVMIHQRYETKDGGKGFLPWTRWSDGQWRKIEPEVMPFYGLPGMKDAATLVLHEGAKAAARVRELIATGQAKGFPWFADLRHAHHVGWIGGVNAVARSDWSVLARCGWSRVIIVADNDSRGLKAARRIAREFPANVFILAFDQRFGDGFDLADKWPSSLFDDRGRYLGPALRDCLIPATQATLLMPAEGRGRPTAVLRSEFAATVAYTLDPLRFMSRHFPSRDRSLEEFNALIAPFSDVKDTGSKVLEAIECQHDKLTYDPGLSPGTVHKNGLRCFNGHEPARILPMEGDAEPWFRYLEHLVPDPAERAHLMRWLATLIAKPDVRMRWGVLLISQAQGIGKNTLGVILKKMLGAANVSFPNAREVVEGQFNGWAARKRLAFVSELYSGHSRKAYDDLKSTLADDDLTVNEKFVKAYVIDNWLHVIACSNSSHALHIDDEDRRWLVPAVAEASKPASWWDELYAWIEGDGPGIILNWARKHVAAGHFVRTSEHAPSTSRKAEIAEESRSAGQKLAVSLAEHLAGLDRQVILGVSSAREWIAIQRGFKRANGEADISDRRLEKEGTILRAAKSVPGITVWANNRRPKIKGNKEALIMNFEPEEGESWADIKNRFTNLEGIGLDDPL